VQLQQQQQQVQPQQVQQVHAQPMVAPPTGTLDFLFLNLQQHSADPTSAGYMQARSLLEQFIQNTATAASMQRDSMQMMQPAPPQALPVTVHHTPLTSLPFVSAPAADQQQPPFALQFGSRWPSANAVVTPSQLQQQQQSSRPLPTAAFAHILQPQPPFFM